MDTVCILLLKKSLEEHFELKSRFFLSETQKAIALKTPPVEKSIVENAVAARGGWVKLLHSSKSNGLSSSSATKGGLIGAFFT